MTQIVKARQWVLWLLLAPVGVFAQTNTFNPDTVCVQSPSALYAVPPTEGFDYTWTVQGSGVLETGQGSNQIQVDWSNASPGLIEDAITVFATDENGCDSEPLTLDVFIYDLQLALNEPNELCEGDPCVNLSANPAGGQWSGPGVSNNQFCPELTGVGTFELSYTYEDGCVFTSTMNVTVNAVPEIVINSPPSICANEVVVLTAEPPGGQWSASCGNCINAQTGAFDAGVSGAGIFFVSYGFGNTCSVPVSVELIVEPQVNATINAIPELCETGDPIGLGAAQGGGVWSADCDNCLNGNVFNPITAGAGVYTVTYEIDGVCSDLDVAEVVVVAQTVAFFTVDNPLCLDAGSYAANPQQIGGIWSASCDECINANSGVIDLAAAGQGELELTYTFEGLCGSTYSANTNVVPCEITYPNVFSPNNDGINDVLRFDNLRFFKSSRLVVTNRWGTVVYENDRYDAANNWRGDNLAEGTYFFELTLPNGDQRTGTINLVR